MRSLSEITNSTTNNRQCARANILSPFFKKGRHQKDPAVLLEPQSTFISLTPGLNIRNEVNLKPIYIFYEQKGIPKVCLLTTKSLLRTTKSLLKSNKTEPKILPGSESIIMK